MNNCRREWYLLIILDGRDGNASHYLLDVSLRSRFVVSEFPDELSHCLKVTGTSTPPPFLLRTPVFLYCTDEEI